MPLVILHIVVVRLYCSPLPHCQSCSSPDCCSSRRRRSRMYWLIIL